MERGTIGVTRVSMRELINILGITPLTTGKYSFNQLYDEQEWNLIDLPKRNQHEMSMGFFRGKTIVNVWQNRLSCFPPNVMTFYIQTINGVNYKVTFSSYGNFFLYPPHHLFDQNPNTYARTLPNVYDITGSYIGGGRSIHDQGSVIKGEWVQLQTDVYVVALKFSIIPTSSRLAEAPRKLSVLGLESSGTWVVLLQSVHTQPYNVGETTEFHATQLIACSSYRLVCEETSSVTGVNCTSFSLADLRVLGLTNNDSTPKAILTWSNGSQHHINTNIGDIDYLQDGLTSERLQRVECDNGTQCVLYSGVKYTGTPITIENTQNIDIMLGSIRLTKTTPIVLNVPFNFDNLIATFMFGSQRAKRIDDFNGTISCEGNLAIEHDATRGHVLKLSFGVNNLNAQYLVIPQCFTICFWLFREASMAMNRLISTLSNTLHIYTTNTGVLECSLGNVVLADTNTTIQRTWIHYAVSFDSVTVKLYRNGVLTAFNESNTNTWSGATGFTVGKDWTYDTNVFIDNIRIYSTAINPAILKHLFDFEYYNPMY